MLVPVVYAVYLLISVALVARVARSIGVHGRIFLAVQLGVDEALADSLNRLLVVGFYLINLGHASMALSIGFAPEDLQQAIEYLSLRIGLVMLILGVTHFLNIFLISRVRPPKGVARGSSAPDVSVAAGGP